jgi:peroxiredoxin
MRTFTDRYKELFGEDVEVVGINADSLDTHVRFAASLGLPFKLLTDKDQAVSRRFGSAAEGGYNRRTVYVIGKKGDVVYRDLAFVALDPKSYDRLRDAVQSARKQR